MMQPDENQIAYRSYLIWEKEGRPDGRALDHWLQAKFELESEAVGANGSRPKRARATTARTTARKSSGTATARKPKAKAV